MPGNQWKQRTSTRWKSSQDNNTRQCSEEGWCWVYSWDTVKAQWLMTPINQMKTFHKYVKLPWLLGWDMNFFFLSFFLPCSVSEECLDCTEWYVWETGCDGMETVSFLFSSSAAWSCSGHSTAAISRRPCEEIAECKMKSYCQLKNPFSSHCLFFSTTGAVYWPVNATSPSCFIILKGWHEFPAVWK